MTQVPANLYKDSDDLQNPRDRLSLLHRIPHMTRKMLYRLKESDPTLQLIFTSTPSEMSEFFHIPMKKSLSIHNDIRSTTIKDKIKRETKRIMALTHDDEAYPEQ